MVPTATLLTVPSHADPVEAEVLVVQVGSTISRSPGAAASIALWTVWVEETCVGALPPMITVTESIDCLLLPAVTTSSPQYAKLRPAGGFDFAGLPKEPPTLPGPPYCTCCCTAHGCTWLAAVPVAGTVTVIDVSDQLVIAAGTPPMVTAETAVQAPLTAVHRAPNP